MATESESILLSISDKVAQSIKDKTLNIDYPAILELCRFHYISSFTLHQIIERELAINEGGPSVADTSIGYVTVKSPEISYESLPEDNGEEDDAPFDVEDDAEEMDDDAEDEDDDAEEMDDDAEEEDYHEGQSTSGDDEDVMPGSDTETQKPRKHWFLRFLRFLKIVIITVISICLALMFVYLCLKCDKLQQEKNSYNRSFTSVKTYLEPYEGFQFADWTSKNHDHSTKSSAVYRFHADKGDRLKADCSADCESGCDFLTISVARGSSVITLASLSGTNNQKHVAYTFPESGIYTFTMSYTKDGSVSRGSDKGKVSNIFIISSRIDKVREMADSIIEADNSKAKDPLSVFH